METLRLRVNGTWHQFVRGTQIPDEMTLAELLRNVLGYTDVRLVCNEGACGACTVLVNGRSVLSCMTLAADCDGKEITTVAGLPEDDFVVKAFANMAEPGYGTAMQCGACTPGFVMEAHSLLREDPHPSDEKIREALSGHICRCGCYKGIERAVHNCAQESDACKKGGAGCSDNG